MFNPLSPHGVRFEAHERDLAHPAVEKARAMRRVLVAAALLLVPGSVLGRGPITDPTQWMVELEGEPAVASWTRAQAAGTKAALGASWARVSGTSRLVAYGVLNDAATSDGSYLPMTR